MNSLPPPPTENQNEQSPAAAPNRAAASLEVYEHERLAFTENPAPRLLSKSRAALLRAFYFWVHSRL